MSFTSALSRTAVLAALGTLALASQPVTVMMQDGSQIEGTFAGGTADEIKVVVAGQTLTLKTATIEAVKFDSGPAANPKQAFTPINPVPATPVTPTGRDDHSRQYSRCRPPHRFRRFQPRLSGQGIPCFSRRTAA
jgi:hypothetical protein